MSKVVIFNGSPRKKGAISQILDEISKGASEAGVDVVTYNLNEPGIKSCQACMYCKKKQDFCCQNDYLKPMYQDIADADTIVFGSPIYMYRMSAQAKTWMDRLYPMVDYNHTPLYPGKKVLTVFSQGSPIESSFSDEFNYIKNIFTVMGWEEIDRLLYTGAAPNLYPAEVSSELLERAFNAGKKLA